MLLTPGGSAPAFQMQASGAFAPYTSGGFATPQTDYTLAFVGTMPSNLTAQSTTWTVTDPDDNIYTMQTVLEPATGAYTTARPVTIARRNGVVWTLTYGVGGAPPNELSSITDNFGNTITFTWVTNPQTGQPMAIASATISTSSSPPSPNNYSIQYTYAAAGGGNPGTPQPDALATVAYLDNNGVVADSTTYQYGNTSFPLAITAILDNNQLQRWGVTYDSSGRATVSSVTGAAGAVLSYQVAYTPVAGSGGTFTRTVTNPLGKQSIYT